MSDQRQLRPPCPFVVRQSIPSGPKCKVPLVPPARVRCRAGIVAKLVAVGLGSAFRTGFATPRASSAAISGGISTLKSKRYFLSPCPCQLRFLYPVIARRRGLKRSNV